MAEKYSCTPSTLKDWVMFNDNLAGAATPPMVLLL
ncbi:hypothetical protein XPN_1578, partial [Xanthomonas arboricola pv. pruni MAFF 301427]